MTVPELRAAINEKCKSADGKALRMPCGTLVSKAKKADLEMFLDLMTVVEVDIVDNLHNNLQRQVTRCESRIRKLQRRRALPNNRRLIQAERVKLLRLFADIEIIGMRTAA